MAARTYFLHAEKLKSLQKLRTALKHNIREISRETGFGRRIDAQRKHLNAVLAGHDKSPVITAEEKRPMATGRNSRLKKDGGPAKERSDTVRACPVPAADSNYRREPDNYPSEWWDAVTGQPRPPPTRRLLRGRRPTPR